MSESFVDNPYILPHIISSMDDLDQCQADDTIDAVLTNLTSSHEPVLVFDKETFLGLLNLNKLLYHHRRTPTTQARNAITKPPYLTPDSSLFDVVTAMLSHRLYILPIFKDQKAISGVVQVSTMCRYLIQNKENLNLIADNMTIRDVFTAPYESQMKDIYRKFKEDHISRIVLVDEMQKMVGIISRKDIRQAWLEPSSRQRFTKKRGTLTPVAFDPREIPRRDEQSITPYVQRTVHSMSLTQPKTNLIKTLIESPINSLVLTDRENHPVGIVSVRDILTAIGNYKPAI